MEALRKGEDSLKSLPAKAPVPVAQANEDRARQFQRALGNQTMQALVKSGETQAKFATHAPEEKQADEAAEAIGEAAGPLASAAHPETYAAGMPLPESMRRQLEPRLGIDLGSTRLFAGRIPAALARSLGARAFTFGSQVCFGEAEYAPHTSEGRRVLGHELAHVAQQTAGTPRIQRMPDGHAVDHRHVSMRFDGRDLIVTADDVEVFRFSAQSGRPVRLRDEDAQRAGADPTMDSYMNDARFVGVEDLGPIPEGTYQFSPRLLQQFTTGEQLHLLVTGHSSTIRTETGPVSGGDWGSGRVALTPVGRLREGSFGSANSRSGFYLHGGIMSGSSGCIDIGSDFSRLAEWLEGYGRPMRVTVHYERPAPVVGYFTGLSGMFAYQRATFGVAPQLSLGAEFGGTGQTRFVVAPEVDAIMRWAGGAIHLGVRLEVPLNDREQFIRLGLTGGTHFRIFRSLFGELFGGYNFGFGERAQPAPGERRDATSGWDLGVGLQYDFGRVQLGLLYDHLWAADRTEADVHRALARLGFVFP